MNRFYYSKIHENILGYCKAFIINDKTYLYTELIIDDIPSDLLTKENYIILYRQPIFDDSVLVYESEDIPNNIINIQNN